MGIVGGTAYPKEMSEDYAFDGAAGLETSATMAPASTQTSEEDFQRLLRRAKLLTLSLSRESGE